MLSWLLLKLLEALITLQLKWALDFWVNTHPLKDKEFYQRKEFFLGL
jgi:hypothetical protein